MKVWPIIVWAGAFFAGWVSGQANVASGCDKLAGFYVGQQAYECAPKRKP